MSNLLRPTSYAQVLTMTESQWNQLPASWQDFIRRKQFENRAHYYREVTVYQFLLANEDVGRITEALLERPALAAGGG